MNPSKRWTPEHSENLRGWIMFIVAIGLLYGMFRRGEEPGPYWTLIIGAMLGTGVVASAVSIRQESKKLTGKESPDVQDQEFIPEHPKLWREDGEDQVGDSRLDRVSILRPTHSGSIRAI